MREGIKGTGTRRHGAISGVSLVENRSLIGLVGTLPLLYTGENRDPKITGVEQHSRYKQIKWNKRDDQQVIKVMRGSSHFGAEYGI